MKIETIVNIIIGLLSFGLSIVSVITVIITLRQNKKLLEANKQQIDEMQREHQLSIQPIIISKPMAFKVERPRFFYSPPEDEYTFQSRYNCVAEICNLGNATAITVDTNAYLVIANQDSSSQLRTTTNRINLISSGGAGDFQKMIAGDNMASFYSAIREISANKLPHIVICSTYKNACGGFFLCKQCFILAPTPKELSIIQEWHTTIVSASTVYKEELDILKKNENSKERDLLFERIKQQFNQSLANTECDSIEVQCVEIPEMYTFQVLSKEEYEKKTQANHYSRFVHRAPNCE